MIEISKKLEGLNRNMATHAAGVVIPEEKLAEFVPLYKDSSSDSLLPSTQFDMNASENAGLVKFYLLGLKTLTVINKTKSLLWAHLWGIVKKFDVKTNLLKKIMSKSILLGPFRNCLFFCNLFSINCSSSNNILGSKLVSSSIAVL